MILGFFCSMKSVFFLKGCLCRATQVTKEIFKTNDVGVLENIRIVCRYNTHVEIDFKLWKLSQTTSVILHAFVK